MQHPLWREDGSLLTIAAGPRQRSHSRVHCLRFESPQTWRARSPYLCSPGTWWPGYTPRHWVPLSSPPTTRSATVEPHRKCRFLAIALLLQRCVYLGNLLPPLRNWTIPAFRRHVTIWSWVPRGLEPRMTVQARASSDLSDPTSSLTTGPYFSYRKQGTDFMWAYIERCSSNCFSYQKHYNSHFSWSSHLRQLQRLWISISLAVHLCQFD
jgi:hypothetical protein